jgi:hypothetical protein
LKSPAAAPQVAPTSMRERQLEPRSVPALPQNRSSGQSGRNGPLQGAPSPMGWQIAPLLPPPQYVPPWHPLAKLKEKGSHGFPLAIAGAQLVTTLSSLLQ